MVLPLGLSINSTLSSNGSENTYYPKDLDELKTILKNCHASGEKVYPVSRGYNWGLGSSEPIDKSCRVINLRNLNEVYDLDLDEGYVTLGPGVTQGEIGDLLKSTPYMIDVTGSSRDTSIVGNAVERGITYKGLRADSVIGLEVLIPTGEIIKTGSLRFENWKAKNHYKYGIGPDLTGLFFQSNFGIVTKMTYKLTRRKKYNVSIKINYHHQNSLFQSINAFQELIEKKVIENIFHIANSERVINAILPEIYSQKKVSKSNINKIIHFSLSSAWTSSGILEADDKLVLKYKIKALKKALSPYAKIEILSERKINIISWVFEKLHFYSMSSVLRTIKSLMNLYKGESTNIALGAVLSQQEYKEASNLSDEVDKSHRGFSYCLPLTKLNEQCAREMVSVINEVCSKHEFKPSITLNPVCEMVLEAVVSIDYDKERVLKAKNCIRELQGRLNDLGHISYRTNIYDMDLYFKDDAYTETLHKIKNLFDPKNIISPGRYLPENN